MRQALFSGHYLHELILKVTHEVRHYYFDHFTDEKTEAERASHLSKDLELCK